jgi:hypothetical protein
MQNKSETSTPFPKDFFKQFKSKESFQDYFNSLFKQGIEEMLKCELDGHPSGNLYVDFSFSIIQSPQFHELIYLRCRRFHLPNHTAMHFQFLP